MSTNSEINFSIKILKLFVADAKPIAFSPMLILNNLALICTAAGTDDEGIANIFGEGFSKADIIQYYKNLNTKNLQKNDDIEIRHLFFKNLAVSDESLLSSDIEIMKQFNTDFLQRDFSGSFVTKVNEIVSQNTFNQINNILTEKKDSAKKNEIAANFVMINSVYISPEWENHFTAIGMTSFISNSNNIRPTIQCIYKNIKNEGWNLNESEKWKCLGIPYKGRKTWLHILLPNREQSLNELINEFDVELLKKCIAKNDAGDLSVQIPIFEIENNISLNEILHKFDNISDVNSTQKMFNQHVSGDNVLYGTKINISQPGLKPHRYDFRFPQSQRDTDDEEIVEAEEEELNEEEEDEEAFFEAERNVAKIKLFYANRPFIYFVTLVNESVEDLKSILAMGKFTM